MKNIRRNRGNVVVWVVLLVLIAKGLRMMLMKDEDYYDD